MDFFGCKGSFNDRAPKNTIKVQDLALGCSERRIHFLGCCVAKQNADHCTFSRAKYRDPV